MNFSVDPALLVAFAFALVRGSVFLFVAPPFNNRAIPIPVKSGLAAALALVVAPQISNSNPQLEVGPFVGALITQAVIGLAMGLTMVVLMSAVQTAGSLIDVFAGFSIASLYDPFADTTTSLFGRFYQLIGTTLLFATNGHMLIVKGFVESFRIIPGDAYNPAVVAKILTTNISQLFLSALEIAGPVIGCLFLAELSMGLIARAAPSLNVFSLAFPIRIGVTMLVVAAAIPMLAPIMDNMVNLSVRSFLGG